ncbi:hypothetical protein [Candidatus Halobonum tyrrellensis]|uniref:DUF7982 domain-containing protein n=1 Tax=Candidatus Halobonum tyrrellensis G22 TaxID=1324957 RepID=V4HQ29_9EURY|nr:hypothetical protein [Candidatus Halobonum tyrrellensis]ESP90019.1 hypothetical protein K933_00612 [Candidatus Halobonum tyrrellensis G22]
MSESDGAVGDDRERTGDDDPPASRDGEPDPAGAAGTAPADPSLADLDRDRLTAVVAELRAENRRLRTEYAEARRGEYRRSAAALLALGLAAVIGGLLFPIAREVLFVLGGIGLFGGALTWFLTPERLVTAAVGRSVYESVADTGGSLRDELGLEATNVYVPVDGTDATGASVRLFVPQSSAYEVPDDDALDSLFVVPESPDERGVAVRPTGSRLVHEFAESATGSVADDPEALAAQLADALVEGFELVDGADPEVDADSRRLTVGVDGGVYDDATGFDHPVPSFVGTGLAAGLDRAVTVETTETDGRTLVTCRW